MLGVWRWRGRAALRAALSWRTLLAGVGFFGAYALVLLALRLAPAASVAAVRESSVVMAPRRSAIGGASEIGASRFARRGGGGGGNRADLTRLVSMDA